MPCGVVKGGIGKGCCVNGGMGKGGCCGDCPGVEEGACCLGLNVDADVCGIVGGRIGGIVGGSALDARDEAPGEGEEELSVLYGVGGGGGEDEELADEAEVRFLGQIVAQVLEPSQRRR